MGSWFRAGAVLTPSTTRRLPIVGRQTTRAFRSSNPSPEWHARAHQETLGGAYLFYCLDSISAFTIGRKLILYSPGQGLCLKTVFLLFLVLSPLRGPWGGVLLPKSLSHSLDRFVRACVHEWWVGVWVCVRGCHRQLTSRP